MKSKRILLFLLIAATVLSVFAACSPAGPSVPGTSSGTPTQQSTEPPTAEGDVSESDKKTTEPVTEPATDENGYVLDHLPDDVDYGQRDFRIYAWNNIFNEFAPSATDTDHVSYAVFKRNAMVEERYGVHFTFSQTACDYYSQVDWVSSLEMILMAGAPDDKPDLCAGYSMTNMTLARDGFLQNLLECNYLDFNNPWWPASLIKEASVGNKLYGASGDIAISFFGEMFGYFMNKDLWSSFQIDGDVIEDIDDGSWTLEKMFSYANQVYADRTGDGVDMTDTFGLALSTVPLDTIIFGAQMKFVTTNDNGVFQVGVDAEDPDRGLNLIEMVTNNVWGQEACVYTDETAEIRQAFMDGRLLFYPNAIQILGEMRESGLDCDYYVLPSPKYDEEQKTYSSNVGFQMTMWCIPTNGRDTDMPALVMEALASTAYRITTPAYYEKKVKTRFSGSEEANIRMFDLLRDTACFDKTRFLYRLLEDRSMNPISTMRTCISNDSATWASKIATIRMKLAYFLRDEITPMFQ